MTNEIDFNNWVIKIRKNTPNKIIGVSVNDSELPVTDVIIEQGLDSLLRIKIELVIANDTIDFVWVDEKDYPRSSKLSVDHEGD